MNKKNYVKKSVCAPVYRLTLKMPIVYRTVHAETRNWPFTLVNGKGPNALGHHLCLPRARTGRNLELGAELKLKPKPSSMRYFLIARPTVQP